MRTSSSPVTRSYDRNKDFEDPDHPKALLAQRRKARDQNMFMRFLALSPKATDYYRELDKHRMNPGHHVQKIVALSEIYGADKVQGHGGRLLLPGLLLRVHRKPLEQRSSLSRARRTPSHPKGRSPRN